MFFHGAHHRPRDHHRRRRRVLAVFLFGGLARLRTQPDSPQAEFRIAIAGPAASFLFAVLAFVAAKIASIGGYQSTVAVFFLVVGPSGRSVAIPGSRVEGHGRRQGRFAL